MIRFIILMGFTYYIAHLHTSGSMSKYINMKYSYLSLGAMALLGILTIIQFINWSNDEEDDSSCSDSHCGHDHSQSEKKWYKKLFIYAIFILPLITGFFFPIATLDSSIVKAKGFHFPVYDGPKDPYGQQQFLRPDTSVYYGKEGYRELMEKEKKVFTKNNEVNLNDENYLKGMETIYNFPGEFSDKKIQFTGFVYNDDELKANQAFVFRFGVIHCVADSGVFGMLVEFPDGYTFENDQWLSVEGQVSTMYFQPFKTTIPYLKVEKWKDIQPPQDPYVYRGY